MHLHPLDISIIIFYLVTIVAIGFVLSKKASKNIKNYFLGGNEIPWYILGVSNASGMFDISGTIWLVMLLFIYGLKSVFIPWAWPMFNQIFLMVFLSAWLRRSNVMTGAEWIKTRFGKGRGAELSHIIIVIFAIVGVIGYLAYGFKGTGKFFSQFLPGGLSDDMYALIILGLTSIYVIKGGMYSVVITELLQFTIMTIASIALGFIAWANFDPVTFHKFVPVGWTSIGFGWNLNLDWSGILKEANTSVLTGEYSLFGLFFMMVLFKGVLVSIAGPAPNYDMQRILATKNPVEASKMSAIVNVVLFIPRYMMIAGLTVLAVCYFLPNLGVNGHMDFEKILPIALDKYVPLGLRGLLMAGLIAAFMSNFAATVNAAPAYLVNDIYKKYINPNAAPKTYVKMSYLASFLVIACGIAFGFMVTSVDQITLWIVNSLYGGYTAANVLKWYWWRFNGYGYFWGMVFGILAMFIFPPILGLLHLTALQGFPFTLGFSLIGCVLGTLFTAPEEDEILIKFYKNVKPWGFWGPVKAKVMAQDPSFEVNKDFKRDMFNVAVGIAWQITLIVMPVTFVIHEYTTLTYAAVICAVATITLKFNWYDKLEATFGEKKINNELKFNEDGVVLAGEEK